MSNKEKVNQLEEIALTKEDFDKIKTYLPHNFIEIICNKLDGKVSERTISYVFTAERHDYHGITEVALDMAFEENERRKAIAKRLKKLNSPQP